MTACYSPVGYVNIHEVMLRGGGLCDGPGEGLAVEIEPTFPGVPRMCQF
jgi:hypothetical protein